MMSVVINPVSEIVHDEIVLDEVVIDVAGHEVRRGRDPIHLTFLEFELLHALASTPGRVFRRRELVDLLWGDSPPSSLRTVDIHVSRVRRKLGEPFGAMIETVRQVGYKVAPARSRPIMKLAGFDAPARDSTYAVPPRTGAI